MESQTVVSGRVEMNHETSLLERLDEREEESPVDSVLVQVVAVAVRGRDEHGSSLPEHDEESGENPGVRDIRDLKLVEAQNTEFLREL